MNGILLLIGVQELGKGPANFSKEEKQDLMHIAVCTLLAPSGYYKKDYTDEEGWPHFVQLQPVPDIGMIEQENFLRQHIINYFTQQGYLSA